jgi:hypothetical protein
LIPPIEFRHEGLVGGLPVAQVGYFPYFFFYQNDNSKTIELCEPLDISFNAPLVAFLDLKGL